MKVNKQDFFQGRGIEKMEDNLMSADPLSKQLNEFRVDRVSLVKPLPVVVEPRISNIGQTDIIHSE